MGNSIRVQDTGGPFTRITIESNGRKVSASIGPEGIKDMIAALHKEADRIMLGGKMAAFRRRSGGPVNDA